MVESDFNRILTQSVNQVPYSRIEKVSDPMGGQGTSNFFDHHGVFKGYPWNSESKFVHGIYAFNLSKIEDHQYDNLRFFSTSFSITGIPHYCLIPVCFYVPRELKRVLFFDFKFVNSEHEKGVSSFKQKEIVKWMDSGLFLDIKSHKINNPGEKVKRRELIEGLEGLDKIIIKGYNK